MNTIIPAFWMITGIVYLMSDYSQQALTQLASEIGDSLRARGLHLATAESCTGGWLAQCCTDVVGASDWFDRGWVTYSNQAKQDCLGVQENTLEQYGEVSKATVIEMAEGALMQSNTDISVSITGIAGPEGGSGDKPVGTVWFAWAMPHRTTLVQHQLLSGDRQSIRAQAVEIALRGVQSALRQNAD